MSLCVLGCVDVCGVMHVCACELCMCVCGVSRHCVVRVVTVLPTGLWGRHACTLSISRPPLPPLGLRIARCSQGHVRRSRVRGASYSQICNSCSFCQILAFQTAAGALQKPPPVQLQPIRYEAAAAGAPHPPRVPEAHPYEHCEDRGTPSPLLGWGGVGWGSES